MHGNAIAAQPLARDGLKLLTADFGATRRVETPSVRRDPRSTAAADEGPARATRP
jgi:hypothetical protein